MATDLDQKHLDAAGLAMRALGQLGSSTDVQISLALLVTFIALKTQANPELFMEVLKRNVFEAGTDSVLVSRLLERVHRISVEPDLTAVLMVP